jgi:hypothetical protein
MKLSPKVWAQPNPLTQNTCQPAPLVGLQHSLQALQHSAMLSSPHTSRHTFVPVSHTHTHKLLPHTASVV